MRVSATVLRRLSAGIFALVFLLLAVVPVLAADTGTYGISSYTVTLEPQSSGQVKISVEQQWKVLSGNIPWVTVGLPNDNFSVENYSGAASKVSTANSGGFSGVRVDLDKDYQPGQTFTIKFTVLQGNLLERLTSEKKWRINYTPGWYDRAIIDQLQINLVSPVDYQTYSSVSPMPASVNNNVITWEGFSLSAGNRFNITVESTDGSFLSATAPGASGSGKLGTTFYIIIAVIVGMGFLIFWAIRKSQQARDADIKRQVVVIEEQMAGDTKKKKEIEAGFEKYVEKENIQPDEQGRLYDRRYGDYITPAIWAAVITNQYGRRYTPPRTGCVSSCACVSCACACACACAGGGGAGCSRKGLHECRTCSVVRSEVSTVDNNKDN